MIRMTLAAAAAFALLASSPALACDKCNHHKDTVAAAEKTDKTDKKEGQTTCACGATAAKDCKCGAKCECAHHDHKHQQDEKKDAEKKS